jgi:FK506-binding protein 3
MSKGEKCVLKIQAEGAYGKAGQPQAKIPPNANLSFEVNIIIIIYLLKLTYLFLG